MTWNIQDDFADAPYDGYLKDRTANTGQQWGTPYTTVDGTELQAGYGKQYFRTEAGKVFFYNPSFPENYTTAFNILFYNPDYNPYGTNVYEWTLPRFPAYAYPGTGGANYQPTIALLCFDSYGGSSPKAVQVIRDWNTNQFRIAVTTGPKYSPLPALTSSEHPDEYHIRLETTGTPDFGYSHTLTLNDETIVEDWVSGSGFGQGGAGIGIKPGGFTNSKPYKVTSTRTTVNFTDFRVSWAPPADTPKPPLHQIARVDGKNGSGNWQMAKRRGLWQYGGGQGWK